MPKVYSLIDKWCLYVSNQCSIKNLFETFFIEPTRNLINNKLCESELLAFAEKGLFMPSTKLQVSIGFPPKIGLFIERQS